VICHKGGQNFNSGHFFTILRTKVPGSHTEKWVKLDDLCPRSIEVVKDEDWLMNESIQSGAHIWIYERDNQTDVAKPDILRAQGEKAQFFIQCISGKKRVIEIPIHSTIQELKLATSLLEDIPIEQFYMLYGSKKLKKKKTLPWYGITPTSTIQMLLRCKGGAKDGDMLDNINTQDGGEAPPSATNRTTQIEENLLDLSWMLASSTNPPALAAHIKTRQATQGNLQGLWEDEDVPTQDAPKMENDNTKENTGLSTDELTRRIYDLSLQSVIQPAGVGGIGGIFPQTRTMKQGKDFTTTLQWNVVTSCPAKGCIVNPYILTPGIPTLMEATRIVIGECNGS
jgi:hypothetical protein